MAELKVNIKLIYNQDLAKYKLKNLILFKFNFSI